MKKYKYLLVIVAVIAWAGCQKLDPFEFNTVRSKEQIVTTYEGLQSMLTSIYTDLPDGLFYIWGGGGAAMMAAATDEAEYTYETNPVQLFNTGSWNAVNNPDQVWGDYYRAIRKVNQFLESIGYVDLDRWKNDPDPAQQAVYQQRLEEIARWPYEARFLRAFYYFELVKRYGGVPLLNKSLSLNEDFSQVKRNTLQECIDFIINECDSAAGKLPLNASTAPYIAANDLGRVTKLAALGLKSRVLIYAASDLFNTPSWAGGYANTELISIPLGDRAARWKAASDAAKAVVDLAGGITLGSYKNLFSTQVFTSPEILLCRRYNASADFEVYNSPKGSPRGQSGTTPSQGMVDAYEVKVNATTSKDFDWADPELAANPYANRDPRFEFSIVWNASRFGTPVRTVETWTGGADALPILNATKTGYYLRKYILESLNLDRNNTGVHAWIIMRLPEIYLNYAEALNEWSPGHADIKTYYDRVRARSDVNMPRLASGLSQAEIRDKIRRERRVEFAFEDHRVWDVRRWMIAPGVLGAPLRGVQVSRVGTSFAYAPFVLEERVFEPKMYLYPIPQSDININGNLIQNPLW